MYSMNTDGCGKLSIFRIRNLEEADVLVEIAPATDFETKYKEKLGTKEFFEPSFVARFDSREEFTNQLWSH